MNEGKHGTLGRLISFINILKKKSPWAIWGLAACVLVASLLLATSNYMMRLLIDLFSWAGDATELIHSALWTIVIILICRYGTRAFNQIMQYACTSVSEKVSYQLQDDMLHKIEHIELVSFEETKNRDLIARIRDTMSRDSADLLNSLAFTAYGVLVIVLYSVILGSVVWYFPIILLLTSAAALILSMRHGMDKYILKISQSRWWRKCRYYETLLSQRQAAKEMRAFNLTDYLLNRWTSLRKNMIREDLKLLGKYTIIEFLGKLLQNGGYFACLLICGMRVIQGESTVGEFSLILSVGGIFYDDFSQALEQIDRISRFYVFMDDAVAFENMSNEQIDKENDKSIKMDKPIGIEFQNVTFSYPDAQQAAIRDVSCAIKPGEIIVCVGENGSGKTTFVNLLLGLYLVQKGSINIDGKAIQMVRHIIREKTACVMQKFNRYQMTVAENLSYDQPLDPLVINERSLGILDFIDTLPQGYYTPLGPLEEGGVELSGGQWQRIAIGRALLKSGTQMLVFDEFTAALDPIIESSLYEALRKHINGRTTIITSHRLGVCSLADRIFVFSNGNIVEEGIHQDLMKHKGHYYSMYQAQRTLYEHESE